MKIGERVIYANYNEVGNYVIYLGRVVKVDTPTTSSHQAVKIIRVMPKDEKKLIKIGTIVRLSKAHLYTVEDFYERYRKKVFPWIFIAMRSK